MRSIDVVHAIAEQIAVLRIDGASRQDIGERALYRLAYALGVQDEVTERKIMRQLRLIQQRRKMREEQHNGK